MSGQNILEDAWYRRLLTEEPSAKGDLCFKTTFDVRNYIQLNSDITNFSVNDDLSVNFLQDVRFGVNCDLFQTDWTLPFKINLCSRLVSYNDIPIRDFKNLPTDAYAEIFLTRTKISSLIGIADHVKSASLIWGTNTSVESGGLGLLLIENLSAFSITGSHRLNQALIIIDSHMKDRDVFACQQELIDADLSEFAQI